jgi:hypothetical protein
VAALEPLLQLRGIVASVEDEQRNGGLFLGRPAEKRFHLLGGDLVGLLGGTDALHVHGSSPAFADEAYLGDELVGPAGHDGLSGRMPGGVVIVTALGATLSASQRGHTLTSTA